MKMEETIKIKYEGMRDFVHDAFYTGLTPFAASRCYHEILGLWAGRKKKNIIEKSCHTMHQVHTSFSKNEEHSYKSFTPHLNNQFTHDLLQFLCAERRKELSNYSDYLNFLFCDKELLLIYMHSHLSGSTFSESDEQSHEGLLNLGQQNNFGLYRGLLTTFPNKNLLAKYFRNFPMKLTEKFFKEDQSPLKLLSNIVLDYLYCSLVKDTETKKIFREVFKKEHEKITGKEIEDSTYSELQSQIVDMVEKEFPNYENVFLEDPSKYILIEKRFRTTKRKIDIQLLR